EVLVLTRNLKKNPFDNSNISLVKWNIVNNSYSHDLSEVDGVVNLMGENIANKRWTSGQKKKIYSSRIDGTDKLISHLRKTLRRKLQFFIQASAIGYYDIGEQEIDENSPGGKGFLADLCKEWERQSEKLDSDQCERRVTVRIGVVLGRGGGAFERLHLIFKMGLGGPISDGSQWMSWIHRNDLIGIFKEVISNSSINGIVNGVAPNPVTNKQFTKEFSCVLKRPAFFLVPKPMLKLVMGEMSCIVLDSQKVMPAKLLNHSFKFSFPNLKDALVDLCGKG
ncbi:MAG: TIGR01777 family oxidoreductase, partial [Halobacteriovoraceae bacterium]|nr:TIGR01777 family oxidoreductase [Halobacteriovoraceae bacterium]